MQILYEKSRGAHFYQGEGRRGVVRAWPRQSLSSWPAPRGVLGAHFCSEPSQGWRSSVNTLGRDTPSAAARTDGATTLSAPLPPPRGIDLPSTLRVLTKRHKIEAQVEPLNDGNTLWEYPLPPSLFTQFHCGFTVLTEARDGRGGRPQKGAVSPAGRAHTPTARQQVQLQAVITGKT